MNTESKCQSCALNLKEEGCSECAAELDYEIHLGYPHAEECNYYVELLTMSEDNKLIDLLTSGGYEVAVGPDAVFEMIKNNAGADTQPLCSGYGVFPDGKKCPGCSDCD